MSEIESGSAVRRAGRRRPMAQAGGGGTNERVRSYRHPVNPFEPIRIYSDDQVAAIHEAALTLLETHGMKVLSEPARRRYAHYGAQVDESTQVVRLDRHLVSEAVAKAPSEFTFQALDPDLNVPVGNRHVCFACTSGPPNVMDTARGKRPGTFEDFVNFVKLSSISHSTGIALH